MFNSASFADELLKKLAMDPGLLGKLKTTAGVGAKINLGNIAHGPVGKAEIGRLQSQARKGIGGFDTMPAPAPKAAPIRPLAVEKDPFPFNKAAHELTPGERKDFAVPAKASNTGKPEYPMPDRQHAIAAMGFSKMHGDKADIEKVRSRVAEKYPDLLEKKGSLRTTLVALTKTAGLADALGKSLGPGSRVGAHLAQHGHAYDLAGLGVLAAPSVDILHHEMGKAPGQKDKREMGHAGLELAGLGALAAPVAASMLHK